MDEGSFTKMETTLPTPFPVLRRIGAILESTDASMTNPLEALKLDPACAGKALRLANSIPIGIPLKLSSLKNAVALLGLDRIRSLALAARLGNAVCPPPLALANYWRHSTATARIAESIGRHLKRYDHVDEHELFSAALLHDIGKLSLIVLDPERMTLALTKSRRDSLPFYAAEEASATHAETGLRCAESWNFPPDLRAAIAGHHDPFAQGQYSRFVAVVHVADIMAHMLGFSTFEGEAVPRIDERALDAVRLPPERLNIIAEAEFENQRRVEVACGMFLDG